MVSRLAGAARLGVVGPAARNVVGSGGPMGGITRAVPPPAYWLRRMGDDEYASALAHSRAVCAEVADGVGGVAGVPVPGLAGARRAAGLSQPALAGLAGLHRHTVSKYERGLLGVGPDALRRLAAALGVPAERLTGAPTSGGTA